MEIKVSQKNLELKFLKLLRMQRSIFHDDEIKERMNMHGLFDYYYIVIYYTYFLQHPRFSRSNACLSSNYSVHTLFVSINTYIVIIDKIPKPKPKPCMAFLLLAFSKK